MSEIDLDLQKHYEIKLNTSKLYKYNSCETINIPLFGHFEYPQGSTFIDPRLSNDEQYLSSIVKGANLDYVYIWKTNNLDKYLYKYDAKGKIEGVEFAPNNRSFIIIYKQEPPVHYNIASGKIIVKFKPTDQKQSQTLSYSFSTAGRYFGLATEDHFTVWDVLKGKVVKNLKEKSPFKVIRGDILISIDPICNVKVIDFVKEETKKQFKINSVNSYNKILSAILSPNDVNFIFALENGIHELNLESGNISEIISFKDKINKIIISDDCKIAVTTDYLNLIFWDLENKKKIGIIYKEKFHSFTINFQKEKITTSSDICIDIFNYGDEKKPEQFIWLNLNAEKFDYFSFSPDQKVLLGIIDEYNAILYNCESGRIIKKFHNRIPGWSIACEMVPDSSDVALIATKYNDNIIKIWNYLNGSDVLTLEGFNTHSFSFNNNGNLLACGTQIGSEIARVWDLNSDNFYFSYTYEGPNNNKNTIIHFSQSDNKSEKLICLSEKQNVIIFDVESKNILFICECPYVFGKIDEIQCDADQDLFFVKGTDEKGISNSALFNLSDGSFIEKFDNCINIDFSKEHKLLLSRSTNINDNKLVISNYEDLHNIKRVDCELDAEISNFIQDNKVIVSAFGKSTKTNFILSDIESGKMVAELNYTKTYKRPAEIDLSANKEENTLLFRYIEFINPDK